MSPEPKAAFFDTPLLAFWGNVKRKGTSDADIPA